MRDRSPIRMQTMKQEVCAVVDRSGSMTGKEDDTLGGLNSAFEQLKKDVGKDETVKVSVRLFDHDETVLHNRVNLDKLPKLTRDDYVPRGQTALLDALGNALSYYIYLKKDDSKVFDKCIIFVATDGLENASQKFDRQKVKNMIMQANDLGIEVVYLGANQDAILEAAKYGINHNNAINYSETQGGVEAVFRSAACAATRQRTGMSTDFTKAERQASVDVKTYNSTPGDAAFGAPAPIRPRRMQTEVPSHSGQMVPPPIQRQTSGGRRAANRGELWLGGGRD